jgi:hypothetical protein
MSEKRTPRSLIAAGLGLAILLGIYGAVGQMAPASAQIGKHILPDGRAYEQVSPVNKNEADVRFNNGADAAADGSGLIFTSDGSFAGQPTAQFQTSYLSRRGPEGWATKGIEMPNGQVSTANSYLAFSEDLTKGVIRWAEETPAGTFNPNAVKGVNMYLSDNGAGSFTLLNGTLAQGGRHMKLGWASADFGKVGFETVMRLTPEAPCAASLPCAYEWDHGTLRLASVLPDGTPSTGKIGSGQDAISGGSAAEGNVDNAVSGDGSRVFFSTGVALFARENGSQTTLVSGSERTSPGGISNGPVFFQGAEAAHGNRVIFTTQRTLVNADNDKTNDLYLYDSTKPAGERLTLISEDKNPEAPEGAAVEMNGATVASSGGVLARSNSLDRVYFVAENQILPGEPETVGPKLYVWDDTGASPQVRFIGVLSPSDSATWDGPSVSESLAIKTARISANGRYIAFISKAQLTGEDHDEQEDVYRYDAASQELTCVSCSPDASPATGSVRFDQTRIGTNLVNHLPRNVSDSGRVFFQTSRGLVPSDSNGKVDVYEYENAELALISGGSGSEDSYFLDASASGDDVFFDTRDRLVGWDEDAKYDAYDARVGGGFPEPPPLPPPCEGDSCQPPPVVPNDPTPASAGFDGPGNVKPQAAHPCPKGKARRHGKCQKKHNKQAKPKQQAKPDKQAKPKSGGGGK